MHKSPNSTLQYETEIYRYERIVTGAIPILLVRTGPVLVLVLPIHSHPNREDTHPNGKDMTVSSEIRQTGATRQEAIKAGHEKSNIPPEQQLHYRSSSPAQFSRTRTSPTAISPADACRNPVAPSATNSYWRSLEKSLSGIA